MNAGGKRTLMSLKKQVLSAVFATMVFGGVGSAAAAPGDIIEIFVQDNGDTEISCPTTACNAICRDLEGTQILLQDTYYRIGSNCSITITDGALLNEALEVLFAFLGEELPGAPGRTVPGLPTILQTTTSNANQNTPAVSSAVAPVQLTP